MYAKSGMTIRVLYYSWCTGMGDYRAIGDDQGGEIEMDLNFGCVA